MSIERTYYCDGPENNGIPGDDPQPDGCPHHVKAVVVDDLYIAGGFIEVRQHVQGGTYATHHFCSWDCLLRFAAKQHPVEYIEGPTSDE